MNTIDLRHAVEIAIEQNWSDFAAEHPNLAGALDREVLVEQATAALRDDAEFQSAVQKAAAAGWAGGLLSGLIESFVSTWLRRLG